MCTDSIQLFIAKVPVPPPHDQLQRKLRNLRNDSHDKPQENIHQRGHKKRQLMKARNKTYQQRTPVVRPEEGKHELKITHRFKNYGRGTVSIRFWWLEFS